VLNKEFLSPRTAIHICPLYGMVLYFSTYIIPKPPKKGYITCNLICIFYTLLLLAKSPTRRHREAVIHLWIAGTSDGWNQGFLIFLALFPLACTLSSPIRSAPKHPWQTASTKALKITKDKKGEYVSNLGWAIHYDRIACRCQNCPSAQRDPDAELVAVYSRDQDGPKPLPRSMSQSGV